MITSYFLVQALTQQITSIFQVFIETHPNIIWFVARQAHFSVCIV